MEIVRIHYKCDICETLMRPEDRVAITREEFNAPPMKMDYCLKCYGVFRKALRDAFIAIAEKGKEDK